jgi:hypothetical protein
VLTFFRGGYSLKFQECIAREQVNQEPAAHSERRVCRRPHSKHDHSECHLGITQLKGDTKIRKIAILVSTMVLLCAALRESQADEQNYFMEVGLGVIVMPEYNTLLNDIYADQRAGFAIDYKLSLQRKIIKGLTIGPKVDFALLATDYGWQAKKLSGDFNYVILPGVSSRYTFKSLPSLYLQAEIDCGWSQSGTGRYDFESWTLAYGAFVGYSLMVDEPLPDHGANAYVEIGYLEFPVDVTLNDNSEVRKNVNLGGYLLRVGVIF